MSDYRKLFEAMMQQGQEMAKAWNPALEAMAGQPVDKLWPTMSKDWMDMAFGRTFNPEGLDAKTRLLLTLAALTVLGGHAEPQIRLTVRHAVAAGATPQEIAEAIHQMAMFGGWPAMQKVSGIAREVLAEIDAEEGET